MNKTADDLLLEVWNLLTEDEIKQVALDEVLEEISIHLFGESKEDILKALI